MSDNYCVDDEWEWYIGELYTKLIKNCFNNDINTVVEFAPGFKYKIANVLKNIDFKGTLYIVDSNQNVLNYVFNKYSEILPDAKIICLNKDLEESVSYLPSNIDLFLANHSVDDMLISEYLDEKELKEIFDNEYGSKAKLLKKWEQLENDYFTLEKIKNIVFIKWVKFFNSIKFNYIVMNQYNSNDYYANKNNCVDDISREVFLKIKELMEMDEELVSKLLNYFVREDDDRFKDLKLLNNTQSSNNWIVGKYNEGISKFDIPFSVDLMGSNLFCNQKLYNRAVKLKPLYINEQLYEKLFNKKFDYEEAVDIVSNCFSITIDEKKSNGEEIKSSAFIDFQSDVSDIALNGNKGSGRAYYFGENYNLKGELTPLVTSKDPEYNSGKLPLTSAIHEAMISNVLSTDMNPSCFQTLAIFDNGESFKFIYENKIMPCGIMIRVIKDYDLYRFSHRFVNKIPFTRKELYEISEIFGKEEGDKFVDRLLHGAWSSGNISIKGNLIDFDTAFYTMGRHPQCSFTNKYKTNYFGYEYLGQLMILESIINSDLNSDSVNIKELEDIVVNSRERRISKRFVSFMGLDSNIYEKYKRDIDLLSEEFELLSKKTFANFDLFGVNYCKSNMCNIFDFSKFFRYYQILKNNGKCDIVDLLSLLVNREAILVDSNNVDEKIVHKIEDYFKDILIKDISQYSKDMLKAVEFINKYDELNDLIIEENNIDVVNKAIKSYIFNEDRKYLTFEESIRFELLDLYENEQISNERIHEIINSIINFSSRKVVDNVNCCDLLIFEEGDFYTVISEDKYWYEFKCSKEIINSNNIKLYINDDEYKININNSNKHLIVSTEPMLFFSININSSTRKIDIFVDGVKINLFPVGKLSKLNYEKSGKEVK